MGCDVTRTSEEESWVSKLRSLNWLKGSRVNSSPFWYEAGVMGESSRQKGHAGFSGLSPAPANHCTPLAHQVATQFKMSLLQLVEILRSKEPAYIRCIKPNDAKQPGRSSTPQAVSCASGRGHFLTGRA